MHGRERLVMGEEGWSEGWQPDLVHDIPLLLVGNARRVDAVGNTIF